jgi:hypothetical protein
MWNTRTWDHVVLLSWENAQVRAIALKAGCDFVAVVVSCM